MTGTRLICTLFLIASVAQAGSKGKIAPDLTGAASGSSIDVIVQFAHAPSATQNQKIAKKGGTQKADLPVANAAVYTVPADQIEAIARDPDVTYVSPDRPVQQMLDVNAPAVNAQIAWQYGWNGKGIGVAIIDSGIADSNDLHDPATGKTRVVYSQAFGVSGTVDIYGHGSHVSGILGGNGSASKGEYMGIAPSVNFINLRVLDSNGFGLDSNVIAAIQTAIQLKDTYNIRVINLSLGRPVFESYTQDPLCQAVEAAWRAGIVVVAAAGNDGRDNTGGRNGYGSIAAPGNDPFVITVGAMKTEGTVTRSDDLIASYSSKGPTAIDHIVKPDLVAPGNRVVSNIGKGGHTLSHEYPQNMSAAATSC